MPDAAVLRSVKVAKAESRDDSARAAYGDVYASDMPTKRKNGSIDAVASSNLGEQVAQIDTVLGVEPKDTNTTPIKT